MTGTSKTSRGESSEKPSRSTFSTSRMWSISAAGAPWVKTTPQGATQASGSVRRTARRRAELAGPMIDSRSSTSSGANFAVCGPPTWACSWLPMSACTRDG